MSNFIDKVRIYARAGAGGDGCLSFRREKYIEFGGPDGANGGKGGDIYLIVDRNQATLLDFAHHPHLIAKDGENGKGSNKTGAGAPDLLVSVPVGTVVYKGGVFLADLIEPGDKVLIARGGRGGRGNLAFKTHRNTAPRIAERGELGENAELDLELKLIADVGLIGFPNAGKSSLLARVSNARPKIADYPFTTLAPHLGLVQHKRESFVMADIPGLIEGAHSGKGLGDEFLRHVERTKFLLHLVDPMGFGQWGPADGIRVIEKELKSFSAILANKPRAFVVTKMDLPEGAQVLKKLKSRYKSRKIFGISSVTGEGVNLLLDFLLKQAANKDDKKSVMGSILGREEARPSPLAAKPAKHVEKVRRGFEVVRERAGGFRVIGKEIERMATMTNMSQPEAVERFQGIMKKVGVDRHLIRAGVRDGDRVRIGTIELEWGQ